MLKRKSSPQTPNGGSESCSWEENLSLLEVAGSSPAVRTINPHFMCRKSLIHKHCVNHVTWSVEQIAQQNRGTICAMP